ncbi:MAG: hypothetical protein HQ541_08585 [Mariniphaga sp.]|nr:hypothetical protein [Mariniphaga sp.]
MKIEEQNALILSWIPKVRTALKSNVLRFSKGKSQSFVIRKNQKEGKLHQSIKSSTARDLGEIEKISFQFERHGVFVHKGVGRGYEATKGFVIRTAKGPVLKRRVSVEWFNPVLERFIPELADKIASLNTNAAVSATDMKIN